MKLDSITWIKPGHAVIQSEFCQCHLLETNMESNSREHWHKTENKIRQTLWKKGKATPLTGRGDS